VSDTLALARRPGLALPRARLDHLWIALPLAFVFSYLCSMPIVHSDFFYNLANGRLMAEQRGLLTRDILAYAPTKEPFYNQPWLTQLLYYAEFQLGGYPLVLFVHACTVTAAFAVVLLLARDLTGSVRWASAATFLAIVIAAENLSVRPQAYSFLPFALTLLLLSRHAERGWRLWLIPPLMALWVNLHGAFLLGLGLVGLFLLGAALEAFRWPAGLSSLWQAATVRRLALLFLATALAMCANPYGPRIVDYWLLATGDPIARTMDVEWLPTAVNSVIGVLFFASWAPLLGILTLSRQRLRWTEALLLLACAGFGLVAVRNVVWWALVMPPLLARFAARLWPGRQRATAGKELPVLNAALLAALGLVVLVGLPWFRASNPLLAPDLRRYLDARHPVGAVEYLRQSGAAGRLFSRMEWGGYLEWELWPRLVPFLDARVEIRPEQVWRDYFAILGASARWPELLDQYHPDYVLLEYREFPDLARALAASACWREVYRDDLAVIYARR